MPFYELLAALQHQRSNHRTTSRILLVNQAFDGGRANTRRDNRDGSEERSSQGVGCTETNIRHMLTGTPRDQYIIVVPLSTVQKPAMDRSGMKLGEMIGQAVREATREALRWQNGLEPSYTRSTIRVLGPFGLTEEQLLERLKELLPPQSFDLLMKNQRDVLREPRLSSSAFAYAALLDRLQYGTLPPELADETLREQAATAAWPAGGVPGLSFLRQQSTGSSLSSLPSQRGGAPRWADWRTIRRVDLRALLDVFRCWRTKLPTLVTLHLARRANLQSSCHELDEMARERGQERFAELSPTSIVGTKLPPVGRLVGILSDPER